MRFARKIKFMSLFIPVEYLALSFHSSSVKIKQPRVIKPENSEIGRQHYSNQIKSLGLGIALGSFIQSGVSIHCVLRFKCIWRCYKGISFV